MDGTFIILRKVITDGVVYITATFTNVLLPLRSWKGKIIGIKY